MARTLWLMESKRISTKIMNRNYDPLEEDQKNGASRECPNCNHQVDNNDLAQKWPGLPAGVKFGPTDEELLGHLAAKVGLENAEPHPFIDEFIPTVEKDDGICYTHPEKLPGVKQDGSVCHFFHRTTNAYRRGIRKRRKISSEDNKVGMEVRWHKTGKSRRVVENEIHKGWKKIMVLYWNNKRGEKSEKTNWVMHQYHLGTEEDEKYVVSKIFYQQQDKKFDKTELPDIDIESTRVTPGDPVSPLASTPEVPRQEEWCAHLDPVQEGQLCYMGNTDQVADFDMATNQPNVRMDDLTWNDRHDEANEKIDDLTREALDVPPGTIFRTLLIRRMQDTKKLFRVWLNMVVLKVKEQRMPMHLHVSILLNLIHLRMEYQILTYNTTPKRACQLGLIGYDSFWRGPLSNDDIIFQLKLQFGFKASSSILEN